jgi:hypothetical protein
LIVQLRQGRNTQSDVSHTLLSLQDKYVIGSVFTDFLGYVLQIAFLAHDKATEEAAIGGVSELPVDESMRRHFAAAMYEHFTRRRSIKELSPLAISSLRSSVVSKELCAVSNDGAIIRDMLKPLRDDLASFCKFNGSSAPR